jgi:hypothetical protein
MRPWAAVRRAAIGCAAAVMLAATVPPRCRADQSFPFVDYRVLAELNQVCITTGWTADPEALTPARRRALERRDVFVLWTEREHAIRRSAVVGSHTIATSITLHPPAGHGEGGASASAWITLQVDGRTRMDCPLQQGGDLITRISVRPGDGWIDVAGTLGARHIEGFMCIAPSLCGEDRSGVIDPDWLETHAR